MTAYKYRHVRIHFRITALTEKKLYLLEETVASARPLGVGRNFKNPKLFVATFKIKKGRRYDDLCKFLSANKIPESTYGLYISILTTKLISGVSVPDYVLKVFRRTGGHIDFVFDAT